MPLSTVHQETRRLEQSGLLLARPVGTPHDTLATTVSGGHYAVEEVVLLTAAEKVLPHLGLFG